MTQCKICNNTENNRSFFPREMLHGTREVFEYIECSKCGCVQIKDFPEDMSKYYPQNYYSYSDAQFNMFKKGFRKFYKNIIAEFLVLNKGIIGKFLYKYYPNYQLKCLSKANLNKDSRIVDVGCGAGVIIYRLKDIGFKNVMGIDPFIDKDIIHDNGVEIKKKSIFEIIGKWDLITFHHSYEHIAEQLETLNKVKELLSDDGVCILRLPTVSSYSWKHYGINWFALDCPRHFFLHSHESIKIIAEKAGLKVREILNDSIDSQFWASEQYAKDIYHFDEKSYVTNPQNSIFTKQQIKEFGKKAKELNKKKEGDLMVVYLTK